MKEEDVLLNITGASLGRCCVARLNGMAANVNQHECVIRPRNAIFDSQIDALVGKVREAIGRLKELRTALISAAVTDKIDVREAAVDSTGAAETGGSGR